MHARIFRTLSIITLVGMLILFGSSFAQAAEVETDISFERVGTQAPTDEIIPQETEYNLEEIDADPLKIVEIDRLEDGTRIMRFKKGNYSIPFNPVNETAKIADNGYVEQIYNVPHYLQQSYVDTKYGNHGTVSSHGCGIASCAMVYSYLLDKEILPDQLASEYGRYNTEVGSDYALFKTSAKDYGLEVKQVFNWKSVEEALKNNCIVIANVRKGTIFTKGGHYIVYYGITDDGKVLINDPSIYNYGEWSNINLKEGFANGFDTKFVQYSFPCWIYSPKDLEAISRSYDADSIS